MSTPQYEPAAWALGFLRRSVTIVSFEPAANNIYLAIYRITNTSVVPVTVETAEGRLFPLEQDQSIDVSSVSLKITFNLRRAVANGTYQLLCCALAQGSMQTEETPAPTLPGSTATEEVKSRRSRSAPSRRRR